MIRSDFNIPNCLTFARIFAAPIIVALLYLEMAFGFRFGAYIACGVFMIASLTDMFDGMIARHTNAITSLGKFLDPLADKLLICSVLIMLVEMGPEWGVRAWVVIVIIFRELAVTGMRAIAAEKGEVVAADNLGKLKTIMQSFALVPLLWHYPIAGFDPRNLGLVLLYIALGLTVFSGGNYLYNFYKKWLSSETN